MMSENKQTVSGEQMGEVDCSDVTITREEYNNLKRDKERLDFMENAHKALNKRYGTSYAWKLIINANVVRAMSGHCHPSDNLPGIDLHDSEAGHAKLRTCREAIDEVMPNG